MQSEPLLLSSAKIGVPQKNITLSARDVLLAFFVLVFVFFGAFDLLSRLFTAEAAQTTAYGANIQASSSVPLFTAPFTPLRLRIETLSVDAPIEQVGRKPDGDMKAPSRFDTAAWFVEGPRPGEAGNTVIAGHLNNALDTTGVFERLDQLRLGDTIIVSGEGREATFVVRQMSVYEAQLAPKEEIFAVTGASRLVLITCDGAWDRGTRTYDKRLVIYADLISSR